MAKRDKNAQETEFAVGPTPIFIFFKIVVGVKWQCKVDRYLPGPGR